MPRKPSCLCGECPKCKRRIKERERYQSLSTEERRAIVVARDREKVRARDRERSKRPERIAHITANTKRWREENPEKYAAHVKLNNEVRAGRIVKADECERPGCHETKRLHAHHDDYSKPLEVRWLCALHHGSERVEGQAAG